MKHRIRRRLALLFAALVAVALPLLWLMADLQYRAELRDDAGDALVAAREAYAELVRVDRAKLGAALDVARADQRLLALFTARDRAGLYAAAEPTYQEIRDEHRITHWYFILPPPESTCFLRVHNRLKADDVIARPTYKRSVATGDEAFGLELGKTAFALRVVEPLRDAQGRIVGYEEMGEEIDHFLDSMKAQTRDEYAMVLDKSRLEHQQWIDVRRASGKGDNWDRGIANALWCATTADTSLTEFEGACASLPASGTDLGIVRSGDRTYARSVFPIDDANGDAIGAIVVATDLTETKTRYGGRILATALASIGLAVVCAAIFLLTLQRTVFAPLARMEARMIDAGERLAGGDFGLEGIAEQVRDDEIRGFETWLVRLYHAAGETVRSLLRERDEREGPFGEG